MSNPWLQRIRQVLDHFNPRPLTASQTVWVERHLNPAERDLFFAMRRSDQRHAYAVARAAIAEPELSLRERWLLTRAGLLHDVGKRVGEDGLAARIGNVLFPGNWPKWLPATLGEAVQELRAHPARGAGWVRKAGAEPEVVALVRAHESPASDGILQPPLARLWELLHQADERH